MIRIAFAALAACSLATATAASAEDGCELHVWPAPELKAMTQSWGSNHVVDHAFDPAHGTMKRPASLMPEAQVALLASLDLAGLFAARSARVVIHPEPLPRAAAMASARQSPSTSSCYSELIVSQIFYDDAPLAGKSLRTLVAHRSFGDSPEVRSSFSTWTEAQLTHFPAATAGQVAAADADLIQAYKGNLKLFAIYEGRPRKEKKPEPRR